MKKYKVKVKTVMKADTYVEAENYDDAVTKLNNGEYADIIGAATEGSEDLETTAYIDSSKINDGKHFNFEFRENTVLLDIWGFSYFHVTQVYHATRYEPEDYDGYDVDFGDTIDINQLLCCDEFKMCGELCRVNTDGRSFHEVWTGFIEIIKKYFKEIFPKDEALVDILGNGIYYELDDFDESKDIVKLIPFALWGNREFRKELGQYLYNIAEKSIDTDDNFIEALEEADREDRAYARAEAAAEAREEAAERAYYDALDRLDL